MEKHDKRRSEDCNYRVFYLMELFSFGVMSLGWLPTARARVIFFFQQQQQLRMHLQQPPFLPIPFNLFFCLLFYPWSFLQRQEHTYFCHSKKYGKKFLIAKRKKVLRTLTAVSGNVFTLPVCAICFFPLFFYHPQFESQNHCP